MDIATRDARGRFMSGRSGNPAGKRPGTLNHATRIRRWLSEYDEREAARKLIEHATAGNLTALRLLLERIDPKPRSRPVTFELGDDVASFSERFDAVFAGMAAGQITPDEGLQIARFLDTFRKVADWEQHAAPEDGEDDDTTAWRMPAHGTSEYREYWRAMDERTDRIANEVLAETLARREAAAETAAAGAVDDGDRPGDGVRPKPQPSPPGRPAVDAKRYGGRDPAEHAGPRSAAAPCVDPQNSTCISRGGGGEPRDGETARVARAGVARAATRG
jgi:hypothetical protein